MDESSTQIHALNCYAKALDYFRAGRFAKAQQTIREYRRLVDYGAISLFDNRNNQTVRATVIIVTRDRGDELIDCLEALNRQDSPPFEVVVVNNGGKQSLNDRLKREPLVLVECPIPFTPSEGRNIGAFHARADLLIFLDDDALVEPGFITMAITAFALYPSLLGIRGRILPTSSVADNRLAGLYDLGDFPLPSILDVEGNMAIPRALYNAVGGMNPLLFGAEGLDLTVRLLAARPEGEVFYWPTMVIRHDYASGDQLLAKRQRQALVNDYFNTLFPQVIDVKDRYTEIYRRCRKQPKGAGIKRITNKINILCKDMRLSLKSEAFIQQLRINAPVESTPYWSIDTNDRKYYQTMDVDSLVQRIHALETDLETTRQSLKFRVGHQIFDALSSPLRKGVLLPVRLLRLIKEYRIRRKQAASQSCGRSNTPGHTIHNHKRYANPNREEHVFTCFEEFQPYRKTRNSRLRIASITLPWMHACLDFEAELIPLNAERWREQIGNARPDFLLVQSIIGKSSHWNDCLATMNGPTQAFAALLTHCKQQGIPTVFWDTEDHIHFSLFSPFASLFDQVFASNPESATAYGKLLNREITHLGAAIQPALHNPIKPQDHSYHGFTLLLDGWADILETPDGFEFLTPMLEKGLHVIESRYRLMANKLDDLPAFREHIMGCTSFGQRLSALRHYQVLIFPEDRLSSSMARTWQAMEAVGCGCDVVMADGRSVGMPEGIVIPARDNQDVRKKALQLLSETGTPRPLSHVARRKLYAAHTYAHRIRTICQTLGIAHDWTEFPLASVILPTKRPELIGSCVDKFDAQSYPSKELIIVINTESTPSRPVMDRINNRKNIRVFQIHQEKNIGACLNHGIAQAKGKYWFKMDDDDFYGPHYLTDMIQLAETADIDILGKPTGFIYLENKDRVFLRNGCVADQYTMGSDHTPPICGATLGGRLDGVSEFSENHRSCVDTAFIEGHRAAGRKTLVVDIWNFIALRSRDKTKHTWRHDDTGLIDQSTPYCEGPGLDQVMI